MSLTVVDTQRYTNSTVMHKQLIKSKKCFQMLIKCAHQVYKDETIENIDSKQLNKLNNTQQFSFSDSEHIIDEIFIKDEKTFDKISLSAFKKKRERQRLIIFKYEKLFYFFNVHVDLYLLFIIKKYDTTMNCNVLVDKLKHK